jgi:hypothetical protein
MKLTPEQLALLYLQIEPKIADQFIEHYRALEAELDNWKDISGQAHDACVEAEAERDVARGEAYRKAAALYEEWATSCWDSFRDQAMAVRQRGEAILALDPSAVKAAEPIASCPNCGHKAHSRSELP